MLAYSRLTHFKRDYLQNTFYNNNNNNKEDQNNLGNVIKLEVDNYMKKMNKSIDIYNMHKLLKKLRCPSNMLHYFYYKFTDNNPPMFTKIIEDKLILLYDQVLTAHNILYPRTSYLSNSYIVYKLLHMLDLDEVTLTSFLNIIPIDLNNKLKLEYQNEKWTAICNKNNWKII